MNRFAIAASAALLGVSLLSCERSQERTITDREPVAGQVEDEPQFGMQPGTEAGESEQVMNRIEELESQVSRLQNEVDSLRSQQPQVVPGTPPSPTPGQQPSEGMPTPQPGQPGYPQDTEPMAPEPTQPGGLEPQPSEPTDPSGAQPEGPQPPPGMDGTLN